MRVLFLRFGHLLMLCLTLLCGCAQGPGLSSYVEPDLDSGGATIRGGGGTYIMTVDGTAVSSVICWSRNGWNFGGNKVVLAPGKHRITAEHSVTNSVPSGSRVHTVSAIFEYVFESGHTYKVGSGPAAAIVMTDTVTGNSILPKADVVRRGGKAYQIPTLPTGQAAILRYKFGIDIKYIDGEYVPEDIGDPMNAWPHDIEVVTTPDHHDVMLVVANNRTYHLSLDLQPGRVYEFSAAVPMLTNRLKIRNITDNRTWYYDWDAHAFLPDSESPKPTPGPITP